MVQTVLVVVQEIVEHQVHLVLQEAQVLAVVLVV